ncbi:MAG TPA: MBL fold metallo-hydrolase [Holophagaceae bacterium]|nr:MBL fold metallo-hydrolase [Holophagaceae bacterium]
MAQRAKAYAGQAEGSFFVDRACIDCGTCYQFAPETFEDAGSHSRVRAQPGDGEAKLRAAMALVACPVAAIGTEEKALVGAASHAFPSQVEDEVSFCGWTSEKSFGASSWFIERAAGNVLMDSPRSSPQLMKRLEEKGGVSLLVLSHQDDVADHAAYHERFGCPRLMHAGDAMRGCERVIEGEEPVALSDDLLLIPTPGHTAGSMCLLYRETFLFTGDHLWWNPGKGRLSASKAYNWFDWETQLASLEKLLDFRFRWVLPGHGHAHREATPDAMRDQLARSIAGLRAL